MAVFSSIFFDFCSLIVFIAITGLIDDKFGLNKRIRFFVQIITTIFIIIYSFSIWNIPDLSNLLLIEFFISITMEPALLILNFVDGIDGILLET